MLCKICGAQIPDDAVKCEFCGADIKAEQVKNTDKAGIAQGEKKEIFDDNEKRRREQMKKMMEDKKKQLSEIERRRQEKRQQQRRNRIVIIAAACALAIAAAGIGVYYVTENITGGNNMVDATPAPTSPTVTVPPAATTAPSPNLSMTVAPREDTPSAGTANNAGSNQSWSATNNVSSGSGPSGTKTGSSSGSAGNTSSSNGSGSHSSGGSAGTSSSGSNTSNTSAVNSGISSNKITSQLGMGGEVLKNPATGKLLMTFVVNGKKYYANVSEGSTTEQIKNKPYTITAAPTSETYKGNTIYEISNLTGYDGKDYVIPESGTRLLKESDIKGMSRYDLALARNEIYARHGRKFQTAEYNAYFTSKPWYKINPNYNYSDDDSNLNDIEIKNVQMILSAERR